MSGKVAAIILAAGESRRMGRPKPLLPWGKTTVLGQVVSVFAAAGIEEIVVVTGGARAQVEGLVTELAREFPVRAAHNPNYANGGMLSSIQRGLQDLPQPPPSLRDTSPKSFGFGGGWERVSALIALGDQPQVREETVRRICAAYRQNTSPLVVPSFNQRRGHPWLVDRGLWPEILALPPATTPQQFLRAHAGQVEYVPADESILQDLDTPEDYQRHRP